MTKGGGGSGGGLEKEENLIQTSGNTKVLGWELLGGEQLNAGKKCTIWGRNNEEER